MSTGWIKLHRQMLDWEWYDDINVMRLFIHCLLRANHKAKKWRGIDIARGQFYTSLDSLSIETGLTNMQLRTCFSKLQTTGEITSLGMARGRMITVVQYDNYQDDNSLSNSQVTGYQQAGNRLITTNKNDNNEKNLRTKDIDIDIDFSILNMTKEQVNDLKKIRKKNKGSSLTQRIVNGLSKEFNQAALLGYTIEEIFTEWETRGWKSFKSEWIKPKLFGEGNGTNQQHNQKLSTTERTTQANRESYERTQREIEQLKAQINDEKTMGGIQQGTWSELQ